jgi:tRNA(Arg) A34 adenosine deaminase TadA
VRTLGSAELRRAILYSSTEPCAMCAGALYWSEIGSLVFGCRPGRSLTAVPIGSTWSDRSRRKPAPKFTGVTGGAEI